MVKGRKEMFYLTTHSTHVLNLRSYGVGHMVKDHSERERKPAACHMGYSFRLTARVLLYAPSHRQDSTYHSTGWNNHGKSICLWCDGSSDQSNMVDLLSYFLFQPVLHEWCNKGCGMCYPICGMVHIKDTLLLIGKSCRCGCSGSLTICPMPYNRKYKCVECIVK